MVETIFQNLKIKTWDSVIAKISSTGICPFCKQNAQRIKVRKRFVTQYKILEICSNCNFNYNYDWQKEDLTDDNELMEFLKSLEGKEKKFSIVILCYNNKEVTKKCILSLAKIVNQFELILVDNGSTDGLREWLETVKKDITHSNLKIILNPENYGVAKGRNIGAKVCESDYICFIDNDAIVLRTTDLNALSYPLERGFVNSGLWKGIYDANNGKTYNYILGCFMMYSKDVFDKYGGFDEVWGYCHCDDVDYCYKVLYESKGKAVLMDNNTVYHIGGKTTMQGLKYQTTWDLLQKNLAILNERWVNKLVNDKLTCKDNVIQFEGLQ